MVNLVGKISKGTVMDQVYIPKERPIGFEPGTYVEIRPLVEEGIKYIYYDIKNLESIKVTVIKKIFSEVDFVDNVVVTGSFLERGFAFNDIDIILIYNKKLDTKKLEKHLNRIFGLVFHIIAADYQTLLKGMETDPLYQAMLSRYVAKKRIIFKYKNKINYKLLDLHLIKSKPLIDNFGYLAGSQKYGMVRNLIAIFLFLNKRKISNEIIDYNIKKLLKTDSANIKQNIIDKIEFLKEYKRLYNNLFDEILEGIKNGSK
ncbi:hypothetical protein HYX02_01400 [Candidatus Woesearchaeota archaeon]|nr:hypothetical protein [Candidatus Woesearchaeota archaeon]